MSVENSPRDGKVVAQDDSGIVPSGFAVPLRRSRNNGVVRFDFAELFKDGAEVFSSVGSEGSGHVFPDCEPRVLPICFSSHFFDDSCAFEKEPRSLSFDALPFTRYGHILTGRCGNNDIYGFDLRSVDFRDVSEMFHVRDPFRCDGDRKRSYFTCPCWAHAALYSGERERPRAIEKTTHCKLFYGFPPYCSIL